MEEGGKYKKQLLEPKLKSSQICLLFSECK